MQERHSLLLQVHLCTCVPVLWTAGRLHSAGKCSCRWTLRNFFFVFFVSFGRFTASQHMQLADPLACLELQRPPVSDDKHRQTQRRSLSHCRLAPGSLVRPGLAKWSVKCDQLVLNSSGQIGGGVVCGKWSETSHQRTQPTLWASPGGDCSAGNNKVCCVHLCSIC